MILFEHKIYKNLNIFILLVVKKKVYRNIVEIILLFKYLSEIHIYGWYIYYSFNEIGDTMKICININIIISKYT